MVPVRAAGVALVLSCWVLNPLQAADTPSPAPQYGFTEDADVGKKGDRALEVDFGARFGKAAGNYSVNWQIASAKFTVAERLRLSPFAGFERHRFEGVPGLDDSTHWTFATAGFEARYLLVDAKQAPFAMAVAALPYWRRVDGGTGEEVREFGSFFLLAFEKELVAERLFAAVNVIYGLASAHAAATDASTHRSGAALAGSLAFRISDRVFVSAEARYEAAFEGLGFNAFSGNALYVGPGMAAQLTESLQFSAAWNVQVSGHASGQPGSLDLTNFERHLIKVKLGASF